jgi:hypothetical protein
MDHNDINDIDTPAVEVTKHKCKFCDKMLNNLEHDNENDFHCQICHIVYDGFAQHECINPDDETDDETDEEKEE